MYRIFTTLSYCYPSFLFFSLLIQCYYIFFISIFVLDRLKTFAKQSYSPLLSSRKIIAKDRSVKNSGQTSTSRNQIFQCKIFSRIQSGMKNTRSPLGTEPCQNSKINDTLFTHLCYCRRVLGGWYTPLLCQRQ